MKIFVKHCIQNNQQLRKYWHNKYCFSDIQLQWCCSALIIAYKLQRFKVVKIFYHSPWHLRCFTLRCAEISVDGSVERGRSGGHVMCMCGKNRNPMENMDTKILFFNEICSEGIDLQQLKTQQLRTFLEGGRCGFRFLYCIWKDAMDVSGRGCHNHRIPGTVGVLQRAGLQRPSIGMNVADLALVFCYSPENFNTEMQTDFFFKFSVYSFYLILHCNCRTHSAYYRHCIGSVC